MFSSRPLPYLLRPYEHKNWKVLATFPEENEVCVCVCVCVFLNHLRFLSFFSSRSSRSTDKSWLFWFFIFLNIFYWLCFTVVPIFSPLPPLSGTHLPSSNPPHTLSSCPWVVHINSLASQFLILFLTSPCLFCTYQFMLLNPFSPILSLPPHSW